MTVTMNSSLAFNCCHEKKIKDNKSDSNSHKECHEDNKKESKKTHTDCQMECCQISANLIMPSTLKHYSITLTYRFTPLKIKSLKNYHQRIDRPPIS